MAFAPSDGPFILLGDVSRAPSAAGHSSGGAHAAGTAVLDMVPCRRTEPHLGGSAFRDSVHLSDDGAAVVAEWLVPEALRLVG